MAENNWSAAAIQSGGSLLGDMFNYATQKQQLEQQNQANRSMANYQYSKDLEMWNAQNEYNTPENQMLRLKEAGLNPNLIYGTGAKGATGNATGQLPKYNAPTIKKQFNPNINAPNVIGQYVNLLLGTEQADLLAEQRKTQETIQNYNTTRKFIADAQYWGTQDASGGQTKLGAYHYQNQNLANQAKINQSTALYRQRQAEYSKAQRDLVEQNTRYRTQQNDWYSRLMISNMINSGLRSASSMVGASGIGKIGRMTKKVPSKLNKPRIPKGLGRNNSDIYPNYNF